MTAYSSLKDAVVSLVDSYPARVGISTIDVIEIPTAGEQRFLKTLEQLSPLSALDIEPIRKSISADQAYTMLSFTVRMAVLAVRTENPVTFCNGLVGAVLDDGLLDFRDVLRALSLVEFCAGRLGIDFGDAMESISNLAGPARRYTISKGYLARSNELRGIGAMGFRAVGDGKSFNFEDRALLK